MSSSAFFTLFLSVFLVFCHFTPVLTDSQGSYSNEDAVWVEDEFDFKAPSNASSSANETTTNNSTVSTLMTAGVTSVSNQSAVTKQTVPQGATSTIEPDTPSSQAGTSTTALNTSIPYKTGTSTISPNASTYQIGMSATLPNTSTTTNKTVKTTVAPSNATLSTNEISTNGSANTDNSTVPMTPRNTSSTDQSTASTQKNNVMVSTAVPETSETPEAPETSETPEMSEMPTSTAPDTSTKKSVGQEIKERLERGEVTAIVLLTLAIVVVVAIFVGVGVCVKTRRMKKRRNTIFDDTYVFGDKSREIHKEHQENVAFRQLEEDTDLQMTDLTEMQPNTPIVAGTSTQP